VSFEPGTIEAGMTLRVQGTVQNLGDDATGPAEAAIVLSADPLLDDGDPVVDRFDLDSIQRSLAVDRMVVVPITLDPSVAEWNVALVVDPNARVASEATRENNQAFAPDRLAVTGAMGGCAEDAEHEEELMSPTGRRTFGRGDDPELGLDGADLVRGRGAGGRGAGGGGDDGQCFASTGQVLLTVSTTAGATR
jgi:hypothetical protein